MSAFSLLAAALWLGSAKPAFAVVTSQWVVDGYRDFSAGKAKSALITSTGEVRPGWKTKHVDLEVGGTWAALRGPGGVVYVGTDDHGEIDAIRGDKVSKLARIPGAVAVVSLASNGGTIYAGTMPGGQIWKVTRSGKATRLAKLAGAETVWALTFDRRNGRLYAGTGPHGKLFQIDPHTGAHQVVFSTGDKRIMSMAATSDGAIWLGTSDQALVFRYDPKRHRARAMADFAGNEVTAMAAWNGGVVAAANDLKQPATAGVKTKAEVQHAEKVPKSGQAADMPEQGSRPGADPTAPSGSKPLRKGARKGKGALFAIRGDGQLRQLDALTATYFTSIAVTNTGAIFAGAGAEGRIYFIDTNASVSTAVDVNQRFIAQVLWDKTHGLAFTTGDSAAFYRATGAARKATYTSDVFDANTPSRFGKIVWRGSGSLRIETRTGNTAKPGRGWSAWRPPRGVIRGAGASAGGMIASPPGRYAQYRVTFRGDPHAVLRRTTVYYLPQNKPTRVLKIAIHGNKPSLPAMETGNAKPHSPILKVKWTVHNGDDDTTAYTLAARREGDVSWRRITTGDKPLTHTHYNWNTETFPDGYYRLRVTASDRPSNSADRALTTSKISPLFLIDNQKPKIEGLTVRYPAASARAVDSMSAIADMSYAVDDHRWMVGTTADGIFDETSEVLRIDLPKHLAPGLHTLAIRVADEAGNIGAAEVTFRVHR